MVHRFFGSYLVFCSSLWVLVFTYREIMEIVLRYNRRRRPIISLPFQVGMLQGAILEKLPANLFTVTRAQVCTKFYCSFLALRSVARSNYLNQTTLLTYRPRPITSPSRICWNVILVRSPLFMMSCRPILNNLNLEA